VHKAACLSPAVGCNIAVQVCFPTSSRTILMQTCATCIHVTSRLATPLTTSTLSFQAACSDSQNALVNHSPPSSCGLFTREFFGPVAQGIHGRIVSGSSSLCGSGVRQWAQKSEWHVALPQAFCGWQSRDSLQVGVNS
jgi:hypothetical protein